MTRNTIPTSSISARSVNALPRSLLKKAAIGTRVALAREDAIAGLGWEDIMVRYDLPAHTARLVVLGR